MMKELSNVPDGILINPGEPDYMDNLDIEERSPKHLEQWWGVPFIRTATYVHEEYSDYAKRLLAIKMLGHADIEDVLSSNGGKPDNYFVFQERLADLGVCGDKDFDIEDIELYEKRKFKEHQDWLLNWKNGVRYDVRCLDGGAWDRTTCKGMFDNLDDAIELCKQIKEQNS